MKRFTNRLNFGAKRMKMALVGAIYNINLAMQGEAYLRKIALKRFKKKLGRTFDWDNPRTLNEIITRNKIDSDTTLWSRLADKYAVREYIEERGYGKTLIELYGIWSSAKDIDFEQLPSSFIIKNTNGCAKYMIVRDKSQINIGMSRDRIASWLYNRFGYISVEPHYLRIEPRIIAERLLTAPAEDTLQANSLIDYKWYCFNGHATYAFVTSNRTQKSHSYEVSMYDTQWNDHSHYIINGSREIASVPKPQRLDEMIKMCETLSEGIPFVRVDLYEVDGKIYFSELTLTPAAGCSLVVTDEFDKLAGELYHKYNR